MSLSQSAKETRELIARSDTLFVDTRNLRYITGNYNLQELSPAPVLELMKSEQLEFLHLNDFEAVAYRLTENAFTEAVSRRKRTKTPQRIDWYHIVPFFASGVHPADCTTEMPAERHALVVPFNATLLHRLLTATAEALTMYRKNPSHRGMTIRLPGYLLPIRVSKIMPSGPNPFEILAFFESVDVNVMISAQYGSYTFGTYVHNGYFISGSPEPIADLLSKTAEVLGDLVKTTTQKLGIKLEGDPLIASPQERPDIADVAVMEAIAAAEEREDA